MQLHIDSSDLTCQYEFSNRWNQIFALDIQEYTDGV